MAEMKGEITIQGNGADLTLRFGSSFDNSKTQSVDDLAAVIADRIVRALRLVPYACSLPEPQRQQPHVSNDANAKSKGRK
jgi:hypothetical protein